MGPAVPQIGIPLMGIKILKRLARLVSFAEPWDNYSSHGRNIQYALPSGKTGVKVVSSPPSAA